MERVLTVKQMLSADMFTIENLGVPQDELVFRAGKCVAEEILKRFIGGRVLVCIGKGNNGADGKVVADILSKVHGFSVNVLSVNNGIIKLFEKKYDIIVDCIFGTGLNKEVVDKYKTVIENINSSGAFIIACDIASGINGDNGKVMGLAVKANLTIAIQEFKLGHFLNDGPDFSGEVVLKDIGISVWEDEFVKKYSDIDAKDCFAKRKSNVNKGNFGKACVFGGSKKYSGSVCLSALALSSLKVGVGYNYLVVPENLFDSYLLKVPEFILLSGKDNGDSFVFDEGLLKKLLDFDTISFGMGMGVSEEIYKILAYLLQNYKGKLIIDADGLNVLSLFGKNILKNKTCKVVITPHIGEFARLIDVNKDLVIDSPVTYAKEFAKEFELIVVLKSSTTVITDGKETFINTTGTPAMAKAGSGDVLSGVISGIAARTDDLLHSVVASSYVFGRAGEIATKKLNEYSVLATDIVNCIPDAINSLFK